MLLSRIKELRLLMDDPESNVMGSFPLESKRIMIHETNKHIISNIQFTSAAFTSNSHVKWIMEVVGQGLSLPLNDLDIIQDSLSIYTQWLVDPTSRPMAIITRQDDTVLQQFYQNLFRHCSQLYLARVPEDESKLQTHVELCKRNLNTLQSVALYQGHLFSNETWLVLVKVVIGICDALLRLPPAKQSKRDRYALEEMELGDVGSVLADGLCAHLMFVALDVWLRSSIVDTELWDTFRDLFRAWAHRLHVVQYWSACLVAMTKLVLQRFGATDVDENEGVRLLISLPNGGRVIEMELKQDHFMYAWYRNTYMLGNPVQYSSAVFNIAINGIAETVELWQSQREAGAQIYGNHLLQMYGDWLFDGALTSLVGYEEGRARAVETLCKIFTQRQTQRFLPVYLELFYRCLMKSLTGDFLALTAVIMNCNSLFAMELDGIRVTVPYFIQGCYRLLPVPQQAQTLKHPHETMRLGCYKLLGSFISSLNRFRLVFSEHKYPDITIAPAIDSRLVKLVTSCFPENKEMSLQEHVGVLLLASLIHETVPQNARYLIQILTCFTTDEGQWHPQVVLTVSQIVLEKMLILNHWSNEVLFTSLGFLNTLAVSWGQSSPQQSPRQILLLLCTFIDQQIQLDNVIDTHVRIIKAYETLVQWALVNEWIHDDYEAQRLLLNVIVHGVGLMNKDKNFGTVSSFPSDTPWNTKLVSSVLSHPLLVQTPTATLNKRNQRTSAAPKIFNKPLLPFLSHLPTSSSSSVNKIDAGVSTFAAVTASIQIKAAADAALSQFLTYLTNFPPENAPAGVSRVSALFDEIKEYYALEKQRLELLKEHTKCRTLRYFGYDKKMIIGILETPEWLKDKSHEPQIVIVIRDGHGKYSFLSRFKYQNEESKMQPFQSMPEIVYPKGTPMGEKVVIDAGSPEKREMPQHQSINDATIVTMNQLIKESEDMLTQLHQNLEFMSQFEKSTSPLDVYQSAKPPDYVGSKDPNYAPQHFRLFLSQLGFLDIQAQSRITSLEFSENLLKDLQKLDKLPERDCLSISIVYCPSYGFHLDDILQDEKVSQDFDHFLMSMGWRVRLDLHQGYKGNLNPTSCDSAMYFADYCTELIFNTPHLFKPHGELLRRGSQIESRDDMQSPKKLATIGSADNITKPFDEHDHTEKIDLDRKRTRSYTVGSMGHNLARAHFTTVTQHDIVAVLWVLELGHVESIVSSFPTYFQLFVIVHPLPNTPGLYLINIVSKNSLFDEFSMHGPLQDGMIVNQHHLGLLVRQTAIRATKSGVLLRNQQQRPANARKLKIEELCAKHQEENDFVSDLFQL
ncbi:hypothetical protein EDD86DRAFT_209278 [Gorgonomyces haynaldii]|nr:hypothetical protein EDD86DRAFT_209278 [Gorgonomyces haynaldii]